MRITLEEMSQRMNQASKLLRKIFNLDGELTFKEFEYCKSDVHELPDNYAINWAMYYKDNFVNYDGMQNPTDFNIGRVMGNEMHKIVNPDLVEKSRIITQSLSLCTGEEYEWLAKEEAYRYLRQVIGICSGFSYTRFRESLEENPIERVDRILLQTMEEIAAGEETIDTPIKLAIFGEGQLVLQLAQSLYRKRGYRIISDLARLNMEEARAKILKYIDVDIMDLKE